MISCEKLKRFNIDRWSALLYLFQNHSTLQKYFKSDYFDLDNGLIYLDQLLQVSKSLSTTEQFVLQLALNLFNGRVNIDLNYIDYLDQNNRQLLIEALKIRFNL